MDQYIELPHFDPILIDIPGPPAVSWYGLMYLCGVVFVYLFVHLHIRSKKIDLEEDQFLEVLMLAFLGVIIGGRLGFCFFVEPAYYFQNPAQIFAVWDGGMYFFGGLILAMLLPVFYVRKIHKNYFDIADLVIIPAPMALGFGRVGNFINGEFWGKPSSAPWAMIFPTVPREKWFAPGSETVQNFADSTGIQLPAGQELINLPRHPVQLYELVLEGVILFLLLLLFRNIGHSKPRGAILSMFLLLYGTFRFWIEFYREPVSHSAVIAGDWFTISMLFSVPMVLLGAVGLWISYHYNQPNRLYVQVSNAEQASSHPDYSSTARPAAGPTANQNSGRSAQDRNRKKRNRKKRS